MLPFPTSSSFTQAPRRWRHGLAVALLLAGLAQTAPAWSQERITLNFSNANIESVARTIAAITGRNVVLDTRAKGTISMQSERPVTPAQAVNQFAAALRLQGLALVQADGMYKVVPEADAKLQARVLPRGQSTSGNQVVTRVFKLQHENSANLIPVLRPLISPNNTINASGSTTLVVTDYADNIERISRIISGIDQPVGSGVEVIPLRYGVATDMAPLVQRLLDGSGAGAVAAQAAAGAAIGFSRTTVLPEPRSNALLLRAPTHAQALEARSLILKLDQPALSNHSSNGAAGNIWVVHLKHADAAKMATTLRAAMAANDAAIQGQSGSMGMNTGAAGSSTTGNQVQVTATSALQSSGNPSTGGRIQADPGTNSLVITASEPEYRQLRAVIDRLDTRRAQIYVESLIAEVNADTAADLGIQWQNAFSSNGNVGLIGTNFAGPGNILGMTAAIANRTLPDVRGGLNLAMSDRVNGQPILGLVANFLQSTGDANILSTPNLITLDNEEARIMIGKNVPFVTGQYTNNNSGNGAVNPFQTIERQDVGLTLRVKPQIGENDSVRMQIYQEVSSVDPASVNSPSGLTTNKRSIESNVVVGDSQIIVLGGLLSDEYANSQQKIPLLGDIPVIGSLFRSENRSRKKTNLMVFLRPIVVRDLNDSHALSMDRYDMMRATQINTQPNPGLIQPLQAPVLPAIRPQDDSAWAPVNDAPEKVLPRPLIYENMQQPGAYLQPASGNSENIIITPNGNIPTETSPVPAHISTDTWDNSGGA